jgi:hypothetical protein
MSTGRAYVIDDEDKKALNELLNRYRDIKGTTPAAKPAPAVPAKKPKS